MEKKCAKKENKEGGVWRAGLVGCGEDGRCSFVLGEVRWKGRKGEKLENKAGKHLRFITGKIARITNLSICANHKMEGRRRSRHVIGNRKKD